MVSPPVRPYFTKPVSSSCVSGTLAERIWVIGGSNPTPLIFRASRLHVFPRAQSALEKPETPPTTLDGFPTFPDLFRRTATAMPSEGHDRWELRALISRGIHVIEMWKNANEQQITALRVIRCDTGVDQYRSNDQTGRRSEPSSRVLRSVPSVCPTARAIVSLHTNKEVSAICVHRV